MAYLVCMGDLRRIACDAWYLPGDFALNVARYWRDGDPELVAALESGRRDQPVQNWRADRTRVRTIHLDDPRRGVPVLAAIPNQGITDWAYHRETVHQFVD